MLVIVFVLTPGFDLAFHGFFSSIRLSMAVSQDAAFSELIVHVPMRVSFSKNFDPYSVPVIVFSKSSSCV